MRKSVCEGCDEKVSVFGVIQLSLRQAERGRFRIAVLCLIYILPFAGAAAAVILKGLSESVVFASAACLPAAVCVRGMISREAAWLSMGYLLPEKPCAPPLIAAAAGKLGIGAFRLTSDMLLLSPAYICLRGGIRYFSLSADRKGFMLLLASAMLLGAAGFIFSRVIRCRLLCAEYLLLSGVCHGVTAAIDGSWELTRGRCGDILRLSLASIPTGPVLRDLAIMNFSHAILRAGGDIRPRSLRVGLAPDAGGTLRVELTAVD